MTIPPIAHGRAIANVLRGDEDVGEVKGLEDDDGEGGVTIKVFIQ